MRKTGFFAGIISGASALATAYLIRLVSAHPASPEILADWFFARVPGSIESFGITLMGFYAKYIAFAAFVLLLLAVYGFLGVLYDRLHTGSSKNSLMLGLLNLGIVFLVFGPGFSSIFETENFLKEPVVISLVAAGTSLVFLLCMHALHPEVSALLARLEPTEQKTAKSRRLFIKRGVAGLVGATLLAVILGSLLSKSQEKTFVLEGGVVTSSKDIFTQADLQGFVKGEITPNDKFYRVSKNVFDPDVSAGEWRLTIDGLVEKPVQLTYDELKKLPSQNQFMTLECISNPVGGDLISNAEWRGVRLADLLELAKPEKEAKYAAFYSVDDYSTGHPIENLLLPASMLAYEMNGEPLPKDHGFPARVLIPGVYGMKNPKWLTRIELRDQPHVGYWENRGWSDRAEVKTMSKISLPADSEKISDKTIVAGVAYASSHGIFKVEISTDSGKTWHEAQLKEALSGLTWVLWAAEWEPDASGIYKLMVRATDGSGTEQTMKVLGTFPSGATGYHYITVKVEK